MPSHRRNNSPAITLDYTVRQTSAVNLAPVFRDFRENVVVTPAHQFPVAQRVIVPESPAHSQITHLTVEHGDGYRRELREASQVLLACVRIASSASLRAVMSRTIPT